MHSRERVLQAMPAPDGLVQAKKGVRERAITLLAIGMRGHVESFGTCAPSAITETELALGLRGLLLLGCRWLRLLGLALHLHLWRCQNRMQRVAFHARTKLNERLVAQFSDQAVEYFASEIRVRHLASTEEDGGLNFVAVGQKPNHVVLLEVVVVLVHIDTELDFLENEGLLVRLGCTVRLFLLVHPLTEFLDLAAGRIRRGTSRDEIERAFPGDL